MWYSRLIYMKAKGGSSVDQELRNRGLRIAFFNEIGMD